MVDTSDVDDLDPFAILDAESERVAAYFRSGPDWAAATRCEGWRVRELLAHLDFVEVYHTACLDDDLQAFLMKGAEAGATDLASFNDYGVTSRADIPNDELVDTWHGRNREVRKRFRERGRDADMTSSAGPYPVGLMAFHVASEYATHADDMGIEMSPDERSDQLSWRTKVSLFALKELSKPVQVEQTADGFAVVSGDKQTTLSTEDFVEAVCARLPKDHPIDADLRENLRGLA